MTNLYTNYKSTGHWDKNEISSHQSIIALVTAFTEERAKNASSGGNGKGKGKGVGTKQFCLPAWRIKNAAKKTTYPNCDKWVWCKHHGFKKYNGTHKGMYMPKYHDHDALKNITTKGMPPFWTSRK